MNGLKAMVWKEVRENLPWAVLAGMGLTVTIISTLIHAANLQGYAGNPLWPDGLTANTTVFAPLVGTMLGLLQILPEMRRDQWAFLMHRPASRGTLFAGKVLAGLGLYFLAMGLPWLGALLWLARPGHIAAPFHWSMALPVVADVLSGVAFYFAAFLAALCPARWYINRVLSWGAAALCTAVCFSVPHFWQALALLLMAALLLGVAAWGSFLTTGVYGPQPKIAKWSLSASLYLGIVVVCGVILMVLFATAQSFMPPRPYQYTQYHVDHSGRILRVTWKDGIVHSASDLNGKPVTIAGDARANFYATFLSFRFLAFDSGGNTGQSYRQTSKHVKPFFPGGDTLWYYLPFERHAVGYSRQTRRIIGYLGPDGFSAVARPREARFPASLLMNGDYFPNYGDQVPLLIFADSVYRLDFQGRRAMRIVQSPPNERVHGACVVPYFPYNPTGGMKPLDPSIIVAIGDRLEAFSWQGKPIFATPLTPDLETYPTIMVGVTPYKDRYFLHHYPRHGDDASRLPQILQEISTGAASSREFKAIKVKSHTLPPLPVPRHEADWTALAAAPLVPPGLAVGLGSYAVLGKSLHIASAMNLWRTLAFERRQAGTRFTAFCIIVVCCGLIGAAGAWRVARRRAMTPRARWMWVGAVFWLGLFGLLMLMALEESPAREACPSCGQQRVVTRETCEHCAAPFAPPPRDGTEIFA